MATLLLFCIILLLIALYIYKWGTEYSHFFDDKNIPALKPKFLFGNTGKMLLRKSSLADLLQELYNQFPNSSIFGFFDQRKPFYFIRDPELIKLLAVKEFDHFLDHRQQIDPETDPLFGKSLFGLRGHAWKEMRSTLSPAFTGSKMRTMFELVCKCSDQATNFCRENKKNDIIELKDFFSRFSCDVIATCAFGIEVNSQENRNNSFFKMGERLTKFGLVTSLKLMLFTFFPKIPRLLKLSLFNKDDTQHFRAIILETIETREKENIIRPDMINLLMIAKKGQSLIANEQNIESKEFSVVEEHLKSTVKTEWSEDELTAQCFVFFFAGFDAISTAMSFMAYELAFNPDIQNKLIEEIDRINDELNGKPLTYDKLQQMKYMDMIVSETLRKWTPGQVTDRVCTNDLTVNYNNQKIEFKVGDGFWIPVYAIHRDPKYYPEPDKFDPERFSDERKHEINPSAYLPFGVGPRNCIGSRFALMEVKAVFYSLLKYYTFEVCEKTEKFQFGLNFRIIPDSGIHLRLKSRKN